jgi:late competence protein required for DNA uptake (superfamily II DNA/RNA helicase)
MALTNAQKQARFRNRNTIVLTARAAEIVEKLVAMEDQAKLRKIHRWIGNHLKNPTRIKLRNRRK